MARPLSMASATIEDALAGRPASFSWQALLSGREPERERRAPADRDTSGTRFFRASARSGLQHGSAQDRVRLAACREISGARAADRLRADGGRGVRDGAGRRLGQCHRHHHHCADDPLAGIEIGAHHFRRLHQSVCRAGHHRGARPEDGGRIEHDIRCVRRALCRARRRFRDPVFRALPRRASRHSQASCRPWSGRHKKSVFH